MDLPPTFLDQLQSELANDRPQRNHAWRRKKNGLNKGRDTPRPKTWRPEKQFKLLYQRPIKQKRAQQLGFEYPRISKQQQRLNAQYDFWNPND